MRPILPWGYTQGLLSTRPELEPICGEGRSLCWGNLLLVWGHFRFGVTSVVPSLSPVQLFVTPKTAARQAPLSFTISWSLLKLTSYSSLIHYS